MSFDYQQRLAGEVLLDVHVGSRFPEAPEGGQQWAWATIEGNQASIWAPSEALNFTTLSHEAVHVAQWITRRLRTKRRWLKSIVPSNCPSWGRGMTAVREEATCRLHDEIMIRLQLQLEIHAPDFRLPHAFPGDLMRGACRYVEEWVGGSHG